MSDERELQTRLFEAFPPVTTEEWMAVIEKDLKGADFEKALMWKSPEGVRTKPFYSKEDTARLSGQWNTIPGSQPFVRGTEVDGCGWEIRQDITIPNPADANRQGLDALAKGAHRLAFMSMPTRDGLVGVYVQTQSDMSTLLDGIQLDLAPIDLEAGSVSDRVALLFANEVERRGLDPASVRGSVGFDPLMAFALGIREFKGEEAFRTLVRDHVKLVSQGLPGMDAIVIHAGIFRESGGTVVQELAYALAMASEYLACGGGPDCVDHLAGTMRVSLSVGSNFFFEIAKVRAMRLLWSKMVAAFGGSEIAQKCAIHSTTALWNKTIFDPYVNMLRVTTESMSAVIGGTDSLSVTPFDATFEEPTDFANRIARNTQVLLQEEAYLGIAKDPAGGSYYVESLTDALASKAWGLFQKIESEGGFLESLTKGAIQSAIQTSRQERDKWVSQRRIVLVGTNNYPNLKESMLDRIQKPEPQPLAVSPVPEGPVFETIKPYRVAEPFEEVRLSVERFVEEGGKRPVMFLLTIGSVAMRKARANFVLNLFGCSGFQIEEGPGYQTVAEGYEAAQQANADIVVLCSSDEEYGAFGPELCTLARAGGGGPLLAIAGYPADLVDALTKQGIDDFIHIRANALDTLVKYASRLCPATGNEEVRK